VPRSLRDGSPMKTNTTTVHSWNETTHLLCLPWCVFGIHKMLMASCPGTRRSFDQFANLVMEDTVERIIVGTQYAEVPLGLYIVRGENVVLLGEVDESKDPPAALQLVSEDAIKQAKKAEREQEQMKKSMATRFDFLEFD
jgi:U6 snRNA-associated Sm-like protein LSm1